LIQMGGILYYIYLRRGRSRELVPLIITSNTGVTCSAHLQRQNRLAAQRRSSIVRPLAYVSAAISSAPVHGPTDVPMADGPDQHWNAGSINSGALAKTHSFIGLSSPSLLYMWYICVPHFCSHRICLLVS
jgi:hypothetical protein